MMSFVAILAILLFMLVAHRLDYDELRVRERLQHAMLAFAFGYALPALAQQVHEEGLTPPEPEQLRVVLYLGGTAADLLGLWLLFRAVVQLRDGAGGVSSEPGGGGDVPGPNQDTSA